MLPSRAELALGLLLHPHFGADAFAAVFGGSGDRDLEGIVARSERPLHIPLVGYVPVVVAKDDKIVIR